MATTNLITKTIGDLTIQHGNGTPDHDASIGSLYLDKDTGIWNSNNDGLNGWNFDVIAPSGDSSEYGEVHMQSNTTNTIILSSNTPVKVAGITSIGLSSSNITLGTNSITYTGTSPKIFKVTALVTGIRATGSGRTDVTLYIALNGAVITKSAMKIEWTNQERTITVQSLLSLSINDFVEVWVENNTDADDLEIQYMSLTINKI